MTSTLERTGRTDIDPRIAARRSEVARARSRRRQRRLWASLGVIAVVGAAWGITRTPVLDVDEIVVTGTGQTTRDDVLAAIDTRPGDQVLDIDAAAIREDLQALPWVQDASVRVEWPGTLRISLQERAPMAAVQDAAGGWLMIDAQGRVLGPATEAGWPVIRGLGVPDVGGSVTGPVADAMAVVDELTPGLASRIAAVVVLADGQLELELVPSGRAVLGPPVELARKLDSARTVFAQVDDRCLAVLDLRVADAAIVSRDAACESPPTTRPPTTGATTPPPPTTVAADG